METLGTIELTAAALWGNRHDTQHLTHAVPVDTRWRITPCLGQCSSYVKTGYRTRLVAETQNQAPTSNKISILQPQKQRHSETAARPENTARLF